MLYRPISISQAVTHLHQEEIIAYPTEAVFGLGCRPDSEKALQQLVALKARDSAKGFILIASAIDQLLPFIDITTIAPHRWAQIQTTWPGPYTWVFPATAKVSALIKGQFTTVAVRVTAHEVAHALCEAFQGAIVSTSANLAQQAPCREGSEVFHCFGNNIAAVVAGNIGQEASPTTIQDAISGQVYR